MVAKPVQVTFTLFQDGLRCQYVQRHWRRPAEPIPKACVFDKFSAVGVLIFNVADNVGEMSVIPGNVTPCSIAPLRTRCVRPPDTLWHSGHTAQSYGRCANLCSLIRRSYSGHMTTDAQAPFHQLQ